jgi:hypothetical protein
MQGMQHLQGKQHLQGIMHASFSSGFPCLALARLWHPMAQAGW